MELTTEMDFIAHNVSQTKQRRALPPGLPHIINLTTDHILGGDYSFGEAVAKLIVRETRLLLSEKRSKWHRQCCIAVSVKTFYTCGKNGHFAIHLLHKQE